MGRCYDKISCLFTQFAYFSYQGSAHQKANMRSWLRTHRFFYHVLPCDGPSLLQPQFVVVFTASYCRTVLYYISQIVKIWHHNFLSMTFFNEIKHKIFHVIYVDLYQFSSLKSSNKNQTTQKICRRNTLCVCLYVCMYVKSLLISFQVYMTLNIHTCFSLDSILQVSNLQISIKSFLSRNIALFMVFCSSWPMNGARTAPYTTVATSSPSQSLRRHAQHELAIYNNRYH